MLNQKFKKSKITVLRIKNIHADVDCVLLMKIVLDKSLVYIKKSPPIFIIKTIT